jgi:hypothetical protein
MSRCPETAVARATENTILLLLRACMLRALPSNGRCLKSHRLAMSLYATVFKHFNRRREDKTFSTEW